MSSNPKPYNQNILNSMPWILNPKETTDISPYSPQSLSIPNQNLFSASINTQPPIKLISIIEPEIQTAQPSKIITLISSQDGSLHFHDEAASIFQKYPLEDIAFVGIWGSQTSEKCYFYDRILGLCDIEQNQYQKATMTNNTLLNFFERPFLKGKSRIFLLNSKGYQNGNKLTKQQKNQLDIILAICQIIILIQDPSSQNDVTQLGYTHLNDSFHRLYSDHKNKNQQQIDISWPKSIFVLYNSTNSIKKHQQSSEGEKQLCKMFKDYNFSILHSQNATDQEQIRSLTSITNPLDELYLKNTSIVFRQIYEKISPKNYLNMKFNGLSTPHILTELTYTMNQHNTSYFPKSFDKAKRSVLSSVYNRHALTYLLKMKQYVSQEKPYSTDYLLQAFQTASQETMEQYQQTQNQIVIYPLQDSLCLEYQKKLQDYIEEKQKNILTVNSKKSYKELMEIIPQNIVDSDPYGSISRVKASFTPENRHFDNNAQTEAVAKALKSLYGKSNPSFEDKIPIGTYTQNDLQQKKQQINKKRQQLLKLSQLQIQQQQIIKQTNNLIHQQQQIQNQIQKQTNKINLLKSQINSQNHNPTITLFQQTKIQVEQLKRMLNAKLGQKKQIESIVKTGITPQIEILQSKLNSKRQQIQMLKSNFKPQSDQSSAASAQRRLIQPGSQIRRTHNSKI